MPPQKPRFFLPAGLPKVLIFEIMEGKYKNVAALRNCTAITNRCNIQIFSPFLLPFKKKKILFVNLHKLTCKKYNRAPKETDLL